MQTILNWVSIEQEKPEIDDEVFLLTTSKYTGGLFFDVGVLKSDGKFLSTVNTDRDGWYEDIEGVKFWCKYPSFENKKYFIKCPRCYNEYWKDYTPAPDDDPPTTCPYCIDGKIEINLSEVICE